jgi:hypothetical protein
MVKRVTTLPKTLVKRLGTVSDRSLSGEFGVSVYLVREERRRRGIFAWQHVEWTPKKIAILGTMPDNQAAKIVGVTNNAAFSKRVSLGIPAFGKSREVAQHLWRKSEINQLGKITDGILAKKLGISESVVTSKRHSLGIASSIGTGKPRRPWTQSELAMLGQKSDTVISAATGRGRRHVRAKREALGIPATQQQKSIQWTKAIVQRMGTMTNKKLAVQLGVAEATVALHRRRLVGKPR